MEIMETREKEENEEVSKMLVGYISYSINVTDSDRAQNMMRVRQVSFRKIK